MDPFLFCIYLTQPARLVLVKTCPNLFLDTAQSPKKMRCGIAPHFPKIYRSSVQDPAFLIEKVTEMNTMDYQMQVLSLEGYTMLQLRYSFLQDFDLLIFK